MATLEMAETFSKDRLAPIIRDTPALTARVEEAGSKRGGNTLLHKRFFGGHLTISGSNSPSSLASRPIRILLCDETDRYEASAGTEGDPIRLAEKRTTAFWNSKRGDFSTPGTAGISKIERLYDQSDRRRYEVACPACSVMHELTWDTFRWREGEPIIASDGSKIRRAVEAWFECPGCQARMDDAARWEAIRKGSWRATAPFNGTAGFWLWQGYSPFKTGVETANEWLSALGRPNEERAVKNTVRGETWQETGEAPDWEKLWLRAQSTPKPERLPAGVLILTAGIDVQKDLVEVQVVGWGPGKRSWLIDYLVIPGDAADLANEHSELATKLQAELARTYQHECCVSMQLNLAAIDSGYATQDVYSWARRQKGVIVTKGYDSGVALLGLPQSLDVLDSGKRSRRSIRVWTVNASMAKQELYGWLRLPLADDAQQTPPGWCEFWDAGREFFEQLTAEQWVIRYEKVYQKGRWEKRRERNEALDTRILARVAAERVGISRWQDEQWKALADQFVPVQAPAAPAPVQRTVPAPPPASPQSQPKQQSGGYWNRRGSFWGR